MTFASKRTLRCCLADQADFSICISREQRLLAGRDGPERNERRKRERDRVCCLYRNRLGRAKARLRAAEFDGVGHGGERTATQTGSGGSLGNRTVSTIRWTPDCHRTRAIAWIASVHASQV